MSDALDREAVAAHLREVAAYLWMEGEPFRARAYQRAAAIVEATPELERLVREARLTSLPRIGASLAAAIEELARRGTLRLLEDLRRRWPEATVKPRKPRTPARAGVGPMLLVHARETAARLVEHMRGCPAAVQVEVAGEVRRWQETVSAIELAAASESPAEVRARFAAHPLVLDDDERGARLVTGEPVVLHMDRPQRWGVTLARATGDAAHWQALGGAASARGVDLGRLEAGDEPELYAALGLPWIPPEQRELPLHEAAGETLVTMADVRGAVHCHTTYSDGKATIEEMAQAAEAMGFDYLTITDHSTSAVYARGLDRERLERQWDEIDEVQTRTRVRLLKGTEADILADGALDWPDAVLDRLDVVIASVHQRHKLDEAQMTRRLERALSHPVFKIWGHPLGRLLLRREPIACRDEILDAMAGAPAAIEINGDPHRLDLEPRWARRARERGLRFVLSTDAHSTAGLRAIDYAVAMARRAGLTRRDVLNTLPADAFVRAVRPARRAQAAGPPPR